MATTGQIIDRVIKSQAQGFNRVEIREMLNDVQNMLYKHECLQTMLIDETTGRLPELSYTQGTRVYDGPANTWRVANIHRLRFGIYGYPYYDRGYYYNDGFTYPLPNATDYREINGYYYYPFQYVKTEDAVEGGRPRIIISRETGISNTDSFYVEAYKIPTQITSDNIQLTIPDSNGAHWLYVFPAIMKLIEGKNHGNYVEAIEYIQGTIKPRMWKELNGGAQGKRHHANPRYY